MSMLAEPRSRQKWSDDPRNTRWASDKTKFGHQMLTKMGWSEGTGLGRNGTGNVDHVKVKKKRNNLGIGMKTSHDDDWIAHQDQFNALLSQLNQGDDVTGERKIKSLEERVKLTKTKIMYSKFVKSKDLSRASDNDLACIFGKRSKSAPSTPQRSEDDACLSNGSIASLPVKSKKEASDFCDQSFTTINTGVSVADYFAKKMATLKRKKENIYAEDQNIKDARETEQIKNKKEKNNHKLDSDRETILNTKKSKKTETEKIVEDLADEGTCGSSEMKKRKKKRKKDTKGSAHLYKYDVDNDSEIVTKKAKTVDENVKIANDSEVTEWKRKGKKYKLTPEDVVICSEDDSAVEPNINAYIKKGKKEKGYVEESPAVKLTEDDRKYKKKKKSKKRCDDA